MNTICSDSQRLEESLHTTPFLPSKRKRNPMFRQETAELHAWWLCGFRLPLDEHKKPTWHTQNVSFNVRVTVLGLEVGW